MKKDDLEAMLYIIKYLSGEPLPWKNTENNEEIMKQKLNLTAEELFPVYKWPKEYGIIYQYLRLSSNAGDPDYTYIIELLQKLESQIQGQKSSLNWQEDEIPEEGNVPMIKRQLTQPQKKLQNIFFEV